MKNAFKRFGSKLMATLFVLGFFSASALAQGDNGAVGSTLSAAQIILGTLLVIVLLIVPSVKGSHRDHKHA